MQVEKFNQYIEKLSLSNFSPEFVQKVTTIREKIMELEESFVFYNRACNEYYTDENKLSIPIKKSYFSQMNRDVLLEINELIKKCVFIMLESNQFMFAFDLLKILLASKNNFTQLMWGDSEIAMLYIFLDISCCEVSMKQVPILSKFSTMDVIKKCYYQLKFLMRRVQYSLPLSLQKELISYIQSNKINHIALEVLASRYMNVENIKEFFKRIEELSHYQTYSKSNQLDRKINEIASADSDHTFSFIICVNNDFFFNEIVGYINNLNVPEGYAVEITPMYGVTSMTHGYNKGMNKAIGKYKIYMHQDIFLINQNMLYEILDLFLMDDTIGIIGVAGCDTFCQSGIWWDAPEGAKRYSDLYHDSFYDCKHTQIDVITSDYVSAPLLDGVLLVTSKDIPWRDELFLGFHHYDVSQSMEFVRCGYQSIIPKQEKIWCIHERLFGKEIDVSYDESRKIFLGEYSKDFASKDFAGNDFTGEDF